MKVLGGTSKTANFWSRRPVLNISKGARDSMIWHLGDNVFLTKFNSFWRFCHVAYETNIWPTTVPKWLTSIQNYIFKLFRWLHAQIFERAELWTMVIKWMKFYRILESKWPNLSTEGGFIIYLLQLEGLLYKRLHPLFIFGPCIVMFFTSFQTTGFSPENGENIDIHG